MEERIKNLKITFSNPEIEYNLRIQFINALKDEYLKRDIISYFKNVEELELCIEIVSKEELDKYLSETYPEIYRDDIPEWVKGHTDKTGIKLVITKTVEYSAQVAIHELVHYITFLIRKNQGYRILDEGIASYIAGQVTKQRIKNLCEDKYNLKTISYFIDVDNNPKLFGKTKGYIYAYFLAEYIVTMYSKEKLIEYVLNPDTFKKDICYLENGYNNYLLKVIHDNNLE